MAPVEFDSGSLSIGVGDSDLGNLEGSIIALEFSSVGADDFHGFDFGIAPDSSFLGTSVLAPDLGGFDRGDKVFSDAGSDPAAGPAAGADDEWSFLGDIRDSFGRASGVTPDPRQAQAHRDWLDPDVPIWAKPGAFIYKGLSDVRDIATGLVVKPAIGLIEIAADTVKWGLNLVGPNWGPAWDEQVFEPWDRAEDSASAFFASSARDQADAAWSGTKALGSGLWAPIEHALLEEHRPGLATGHALGLGIGGHGLYGGVRWVKGAANRKLDEGLMHLSHLDPIDPTIGMYRTGFVDDLPSLPIAVERGDLAMGKFPVRGYSASYDPTDYAVEIGFRQYSIYPPGMQTPLEAERNAWGAVLGNPGSYTEADIPKILAAQHRSFVIEVYDADRTFDAATKLMQEGMAPNDVWFMAATSNRGGAKLMMDWHGADAHTWAQGADTHAWALRRFGFKTDENGFPLYEPYGTAALRLLPDMPERTAYLGNVYSGRLPGSGTQAGELAIQLAWQGGQDRVVGYTVSPGAWRTFQTYEIPRAPTITDIYIEPDAPELIRGWLATHPTDPAANVLRTALQTDDPMTALHRLPLADKLRIPEDGVRIGFEFDLRPSSSSEVFWSWLRTPFERARDSMTGVNEWLNPLRSTGHREPEVWQSDATRLAERQSAAYEAAMPERSALVEWMDDKWFEHRW